MNRERKSAVTRIELVAAACMVAMLIHMAFTVFGNS